MIIINSKNENETMKTKILFTTLLLTAFVSFGNAQQKKQSNIVVIMADDVGMWNLGA